MTSPGIQLFVIWHRQRFLFASPIDSPQFDVAPALREDEKTEALKNRCCL